MEKAHKTLGEDWPLWAQYIQFLVLIFIILPIVGFIYMAPIWLTSMVIFGSFIADDNTSYTDERGGGYYDGLSHP